MLKVQQLMPTPTSTPMDNTRCQGWVECAMPARPAQNSVPPAINTRRAPMRSASMPVKGCATPQIRLDSATDNPNTSRPQPLARLIGCRNKPKP